MFPEQNPERYPQQQNIMQEVVSYQTRPAASLELGIKNIKRHATDGILIAGQPVPRIK